MQLNSILKPETWIAVLLQGSRHQKVQQEALSLPSWAGEMTREVKCLSQKFKDMSLVPRTFVKKLVACACNTSTGRGGNRVETEKDAGA